MKKLYFIRHGLSEMNLQGVFAGRTDTPLTVEGKEQARAAGKRAKDYHIDMIVSSPSQRALNTAHIIAAEIDYPVDQIHINPLFVERDFGSLEGKPWSPDLSLDGFSDIETDHSLLTRAHLGLKWLQALDAENILLVSHGAYGRALRSAVRNLSQLTDQRLSNAQIEQWI